MRPAPKNATFAPESASKQDAKKAARTARIQENQAAKKAAMDAKIKANQPAPKPAPKPMPMPAPDIKADIDAKQAARDAIAPRPTTPAARPTTPAPTVGNVRNYIQNQLSGSGSSDVALKNAIDAASTKFNQPAPSTAPPANARPMAPTPGGAPAMKKGGSVRNKPAAKFSSGGSTSKASSRGDGIAQRGKTKGRYI